MTDSGHLVIRGATIVSLDPAVGDPKDGDIEIRDGLISAIGHDLEASGATIIDGRDRIAMPGFVDTHWHLWGSHLRGVVGDGPATGYFARKAQLSPRFTPVDTRAGVRLGAASGLLAGITTIHDWAHNVMSHEDAEANLEALRDIGVRARWSYGAPSTTPGLTLEQMAAAMAGSAVGVDQPMDINLAVELRDRWRDDPRVDVGVAVRGPSRSTADVVRAEFAAAREAGLPISMHCAGTREELLQIDQIDVLARHGLLGPDLLIAHGNHLPDSAIAQLAEHDIPVSVSPLSELRLAMGFPRIGDLMAAGIRVSLSLDSTAVTSVADPFAQMRAAIGTTNVMAGDATALSPRRALEMATIDGARSLGLDAITGSLTPGKRADIVLVATDGIGIAPTADPVIALVFAATPEDVRTVLVDGRPLVHERRLLTVDAHQIVADATISLNELCRRAGVAWS